MWNLWTKADILFQNHKIVTPNQAARFVFQHENMFSHSNMITHVIQSLGLDVMVSNICPNCITERFFFHLFILGHLKTFRDSTINKVGCDPISLVISYAPTNKRVDYILLHCLLCLQLYTPILFDPRSFLSIPW